MKNIAKISSLGVLTVLLSGCVYDRTYSNRYDYIMSNTDTRAHSATSLALRDAPVPRGTIGQQGVSFTGQESAGAPVNPESPAESSGAANSLGTERGVSDGEQTPGPVQPKIQVDSTLPADPLDQELSSRVRSSLRAPGTPPVSPEVDIQSSQGEVTVRGNVGSDLERRRIERQIRNQPGVNTLNNQLDVSVPRNLNQSSGPTVPAGNP